MGVYTFICKTSGSGKSWTAKQYSGELEGSAGSPYELQRALVNEALKAEASGPVQSSFSYVTPSSAIFQVIIGGAVGGGAFIGAGSAGGAPSGGAAAAAPAVEDKKEEKKEEKEEESDEDMGFSLFD